MTELRKGIIALVIALISLGGALAIESWQDVNFYKAQAWGDDSDFMSMITTMNNNLLIGEDGVWKTLNTDLAATGAERVQLDSLSQLTLNSGGDVATSKNSVSQIYYLPQGTGLLLSNDITIDGSIDRAAAMSAQMSVLDPNTNEPIVTFLSNSGQDDVDVIVNQALADMGFTMSLDEIMTIAGNVQYSTDNSDRHGPITALYGQSKNIPVSMGEE